ncbi:MAG: pilus assembly protein PilM [Hungatella sp.]
MADRVLSIEIAYGLTKVCEMDYKAKQPRVYRCFDFETPAETLSEGQIINSEAFEKILREQLETHQIKTRKVIFTIASAKIANREVTIPYISEKKIAGLVRANAVDYFPIDLIKYKVTYTILEKCKTKEDQHLRLLLFAVPLILLESYFAMAERCALTILAIDYVGNSIFQLFRSEVDEGVHAIVKVDERNSMITILNHNTIALQRTIAYGVEEALQAFCEYREKTDQNGAFAYSKAVDEFRKTECIILESDLSQNEMGTEPVMESLQYLVNNIARVLDYYMTKNPESVIKDVKLIGMAADFIGMDHLIAQETGLLVEPVASLVHVQTDDSKGGVFIPVQEYGACIGATFAPVNLLLAATKKKKTEEETMGVTLILFSLLIGASLFLVGYSTLTHYMIAQVQKDLVVEIEQLKPAEEIYDSYKNAQNSFQNLTDLYQLTTTPNEELLAFIQEMEVKMPSQISVLTFHATPEGIDMNLETPSKETAAEVLMQFRTFESLSEVHSSGITETTDDAGKKTIEMDLIGTYR